jgi:hypothetical protein
MHAVVGITRRWVRNFAEFAKPLSRLLGNVDWRWGDSEQLSFELVRIKCAGSAPVYGIDWSKAVHLYSDVSKWGAGMVITQYHDPTEIDPGDTKKKGLRVRPNASIEVPVIYDAFTLSATERNYPTYKRELCAIVRFCTKYDYLLKDPDKAAVVYTDHKPLTYSLKSDLHEGIYSNWAIKLRALNLHIEYIPGPRNAVADGLSRTIFEDADCLPDDKVRSVMEELDLQGSERAQWIWKDGKGGLEDFLKSLTKPVESRAVSATVSAFVAAVRPSEWAQAYLESEWHGDIYRYHLTI